MERLSICLVLCFDVAFARWSNKIWVYSQN
jgi:hypothetical protein